MSTVKKSPDTEDDKMQQINLNTDNIARVLIIGETGAGKSTLINYLTNYFRDGSIDNIKVAIPSKFRPNVTEDFTHSEKATNDRSVSQTQICRQYRFQNIRHGNREYLFLDTPGFGDVGGLSQDEINTKNIIDAVLDLGGLTAVILVINGTNIRLTLNIQVVLYQLWSNFPDAIIESAIVVLTNVQRHAVSFDFYKLKLNGNVYPIYMQNSAFSSSESSWTSASKLKLEEDWKNSMAEIDRMINIIDTFQNMSVEPFKNMMIIRNEIKSQLHDARMHLSQILQMQNEIHAYQGKAKEYDNDKDKFKHFIQQIQEKREKVPAAYYNMICSKCDRVCHVGCHLEETTIKDHQIFRHSWALDDQGKCVNCPQRCDYTQHYQDKVKFIITKPSHTQIIDEIKLKYDQATKNRIMTLVKINSLTDAKNLLEKALAQQILNIKEQCEKLKDICSNFDLSNELLIMINQIEVESLTLDTLESKKQANDMITSLKELYDRIHKEYAERIKRKPEMKVIDNYKPPTSATLPKIIDPIPQQPVCKQDDNNDSSDSDDNPASRTIFIRNLPTDITRVKIIDVFSTVGPIERHGGDYKVHIYTNKYGVSTGGALIQYENKHLATSAIRKYNRQFVKDFGTKIDVKISDRPVMGAGGNDKRTGAMPFRGPKK